MSGGDHGKSDPASKALLGALQKGVGAPGAPGSSPGGAACKLPWFPLPGQWTRRSAACAIQEGSQCPLGFAHMRVKWLFMAMFFP